MDKDTLIAGAEALSELHARHHPLVLPTVWDAWSAKTAVEAGFAALTIGSHPLATRGARLITKARASRR
jgi:2-methylisocitrate lyase-like PEP mutase family enzyme